MFPFLCTIISLLLYWKIPKEKRPWVLVFFSLLIISWWDLPSTAWAITLSLFTWIFAQRWKTSLLIGFLLLQLILVKILLPISPLGLSFTTFCLIHYVIAQKRRKLPPHSFPQYLSWVYFFPIFSAGPIERFDHFLAEQSPDPNWLEGSKRFIFGMLKKWILVEWLFESWTAESLLEGLSFVELWSVLLILFIKLYLDFSAYCDLALGVAHFFGFSIMENFNFPFLSQNISEFWKRWHISLSLWCQEYIYLPLLGITRNPYISILSTFLLMGLWHDISLQWSFWGLWHGFGLMIHIKWKRFSRGFLWKESWWWKGFSMLLTILFVSLTGVFTQINDVADIQRSLELFGQAFGVIW